MIIVLCGRSNSGKGTFAKALTSLDSNIIHLDIDKIAHYINDKAEVIEKISNTFGRLVIKDNKVDRKELGKIVFNNKDKMKKLEDITWKYMEKEIDEFIANNEGKIVVLDYIMLPKTKYFKEADVRILIKASYEERLKRAMKRDNITKELFDQRDGAAIEHVESEFEYVIDTSDSNIKDKVVEVYEQSIVSR